MLKWNNSTIWKPVIVLCAVLLACTIAVLYRSTAPLGCVDIDEVWEHFDMRKELSDDLTRRLSANKKELDSLNFRFERSRLDVNAEPVSVVQYVELKRRITEEIEELETVHTQHYDEMIRGRMSSYLKDFSQSKGLKVLIAYQDSFPVLYCDASHNYTKEAIKYLNSKYAGK